MTACPSQGGRGEQLRARNGEGVRSAGGRVGDGPRAGGTAGQRGLPQPPPTAAAVPAPRPAAPGGTRTVRPYGTTVSPAVPVRQPPAPGT